METDKSILTTLSVLAALFQIAGFYFLSSIASKQLFNINQNFLLKVLSSAEILASVSLITRYCMADDDSRSLILVELYMVGSTMLNLTMHVIVIDRFFLCYLNKKYVLYFKTLYIKTVISLLTIACFSVFGVKIYAIYMQKSWLISFESFHYYTVSVLTLLYLLEAIVTYVYIFKTVRRGGRKLSAAQKKPPIQRKTLRVPLIIVFTYTIFVVIPDVILYFDNIPHAVVVAMWCSYSIGYISDALVYIILLPKIRNELLKQWRKVTNTQLSLRRRDSYDSIYNMRSEVVQL